MNYTVMAPETYRLDKAKLIHSTVGCGSISNRAVVSASKNIAGSATLGLYILSFQEHCMTADWDIVCIC